VSRISGVLIVPPDQMLEVEPNDALETAQPMGEGVTIAGRAAVGDPGFALGGFSDVIIADLFRLTTVGAMRVTLTIGTNDLDLNDLDLVVVDDSGILVDFSEGLISTEVVHVPEAGSYFVGVRAYDGASVYTLAAIGTAPGGPEAGSAGAGRDRFVAGEILVKMRPGKLAGSERSAVARTLGADWSETLPPGIEKMTVTLPPARASAVSRKLDAAAVRAEQLRALTLQRVRELAADPRVEYAEPNYLYGPLLVPNDELFELQWNHSLINLPEAWDHTVGSDDIVVAVLDTGVVEHPDLRDRLVAGFDFISDVGNANDGDRIDPDPTDPGDDPRGQSSSFHGTHVAGTVGASTDNGRGVAGVTWQARIMPLRVLGVDGAANGDIAQAIRYAAGLPNSSDTVPERSARVINLSLGGPDFSRTVRDAVDAARARGVVVVAAAGNDNSGRPSYPAALDGVLSVAAVDATSSRAPYSNFGDTIDVAAPGGNTRLDSNGDDYVDGVLSTLADDTGRFDYVFLQGTSMASPHVAGVVALMLAVNPDLTPGDVDLLIEGLHPDTSRRVTRDLGLLGRDDLFGHGLIDAAAAVSAALEATGGAVLEGSLLRLSVAKLDFDTFLRTLTFEVTNPGSDPLMVSAIESEVPWVEAEPAAGLAPFLVTVRVDRDGLPDGISTASLRVVSDATLGDSAVSLEVSVTVAEEATGNVGEVTVLALDEDSLDPVVGVSTTIASSYSYDLGPLAPGSYVIVAGTDRDGDGLICDIEDACGLYPTPVRIERGLAFTEADFVLDELLGPQTALGGDPIELFRPFASSR
jgi:serine protease